MNTSWKVCVYGINALVGQVSEIERTSEISDTNQQAGFILERGFEGFLQFKKKNLHEIYVSASNGVHKIVSKNKY